ncbi:ABC transporter substrate-binding protein [Streptomyces candidus]|uniref:Multiple sugar transport system substrate-binding protein n=1 Tax=Streptomyces candidus TaxID=67283 RepID=A0A7X0LQ78_9ACTN|nr:extracellular solute-binding protein [Streptomyces candidus]MBB6435646.1 multiple sugar transport system substrate-binding protein [Streptomyces candidus]GHH46683.1 solute-binding protein [Streptomyces candidus]
MERAVQRRYLGLTAAIAALAVATTVAGCGSLGIGGSDEVTLKFVAADYNIDGGDGTKKYWNNLAREFETKNPGVKVDVSIHSWNDVDRKVAEMVEAGKAPDIAQIGAYADYVADGKLYAVEEMVSIPTQANFLAPLAKAGEVDRMQYGMPFVGSTRLMFYNKDLFEKAGIDSAPKTWDALAADAKTLKEEGVKYPFALPLGPEEAQAETMNWMLAAGSGYTDDIGAYSINSADNIGAFTFLKDKLVGPGLTGPVAPGKLNRKEAFAAFAKGEVGMLNGHPSLMQQAEKNGVEYEMVPLPTKDGKQRSAMGVADWMMGFKQNGHRKEIGKFLDFAYEDANVLAFADEFDLQPVTLTATDKMLADSKHQKTRKFLDAMPTAKLYPVGKTSWAKVSENIKQEIGAAVEPGNTPGGVLGALSREAAAVDSAQQ